MTRKITCGARWTAFPPHCSGGNTFRVLVPTTPVSKVKAIAKYKRALYLKKTSTESTAMETSNGSSAEASAVGDSNEQRDDEQASVMLQTPSIGVVVPANKMQSISDENIQRELQSIDRNYLAIRREMNALTTVRASLLWLLKKSVALETSLNNAPTNPSAEK